ncbi:glycoside hydrolase family 19 protein [Flectobacillus major]|uniref:glycoside hydrolase family 19 protein n=1 Tax=Flectobacillus major TaxID=103 RepID=UPI0003FCA78F|nr:hypothetical protein [Flectobacillus major]
MKSGKNIAYLKGQTLGGVGQVQINNVCIDNLQIKFSTDGPFKIDPNSKTKTNQGINFSEPNSTNILLSVNVQDSERQKEKVDAVWGFLSGDKTNATFPITGEQLHNIFQGTDLSRCTEVANIINKYSDKFELNTPLRMAHFLGQIGWESNQLKAMGEGNGEGTCFKKASGQWNNIWFRQTWKEIPFSKECSDAPDDNQSKEKILKNGWDKIEDVPKRYICDGGEVSSSEAGKRLYCFVYRCEGGNGDENSCDGYRYRGHGIMQLTWKKQYIAFDKWLQSKGFVADYNKSLSDPDEGFKNTELNVLSGMWFWNKADCNNTADTIESGSTQSEFDKITKKNNTGLDASDKRKEIFENSYSILKK